MPRRPGASPDKVHIVETADKGQANFIVDVVTTDPRVEDSRVTEAVAQRAAFRLPAALILLADGGYDPFLNGVIG